MNTKNTKKHWHLYVLRLEDGKFYVGITSKTPQIRMQEHLDGVRVAYWTAKHRPIEIIHAEDLGYILKSTAEKRENKMVRALMKQRGINNVRGGDLTSVEDYIPRFGYFWLKREWETVMYVIASTMFIGYLLIDKHFL